MDNNGEERHLYTKGDKDTVVKRCECVHTLLMFCPIEDKGMMFFKRRLDESLWSYFNREEAIYKDVPVIDVFVCYMEAINDCKDGVNTDILYGFWGVVQSFKNLKYLNLDFTDDEWVLKAYEYVRGSDKSKTFDMVQHIYRIESLEFILGNMFTQDIVDMINRVLMFDEIIPNSYLQREFLILFEYDEWCSYMDMFCSNNSSRLCEMDTSIIDYLLLFPKIVSLHKPIIRVLTNYSQI